MKGVFVDTSAWIGLLNRNDHDADRLLRYYDELWDARIPLVTSTYVVAETATRLRYDAGLPVMLLFRDTLAESVRLGRLALVHSNQATDREAWRILEQYADVKLSFTDASSAAAARSAAITDMFSLDSDFAALGFAVRPGRA